MAATDRTKVRSRRFRAMLWTLVVIVAGAVLFPTAGYLITGLGPAQAQVANDTNQRANFWRAVRGGNEGYSAVRGPETGTLINNGGQNWRQLRDGPVATYGGWLVFGTLIVIMLFYAFRGRVDIEKPRSGRSVPRWNRAERIMHWYTATLFIILAITGLSLLFGRVVLVPLLGLQGNAGWAAFAMSVHNYVGPFFTIGVLAILISWVRHNIPSGTDLKWFAAGGGFKPGAHPSADKANAGEKVWFWIVVLVGLVAVCVTGLILDFPIFGQTRADMQLSNLIHGVASLIWIAVFLGHAYVGTLGTEGALEGMTTGRVSSEWAEQHHDIWYDKVKHLEQIEQPEVSGRAIPTGGGG